MMLMKKSLRSVSVWSVNQSSAPSDPESNEDGQWRQQHAACPSVSSATTRYNGLPRTDEDEEMEGLASRGVKLRSEPEGLARTWCRFTSVPSIVSPS
jgi:hypothetical protein